MEAIKELETLYELAVKYEVSPVMISRWKKEFIENSAAAFEAPKAENATETEYASYKLIVDAHSLSRPVYTTTGNHDAKGEGVNETLWKQYTCQDITFEVSRTLAYF